MLSSYESIAKSLASSITQDLVDELLATYKDAKLNFFAGGLRLSAVEGGRCCEAALRILEERSFGTFTPLGRALDFEGIVRKLASMPANVQPDSVRLHIPRCLRVIYDIRNKRDAAHLGDGIDPNLQDASLVVGTLDWVLAEFVRLYHSISPDEAQRLVEDLVTRQAPVIQDFDGFLKVLKPELHAGDTCSLLLYQRGARGATFEDLRTWVPPRMRSNLRRTLQRLVHEKGTVHLANERYRLTIKGQKEVEAKWTHQPPLRSAVALEIGP